MNTKKLLGVKIAGFVGAAILVAAGLLILLAPRTSGKSDGGQDAPPGLAGEYRHAREYIRAADACPDAPAALRQGKPYNPFGVRPDARGWPRDGGGYVVFLCWRDRLSAAARAEYVKRCLAGAGDEWLRSERYGGGTLPAWALGYLLVAYNASDSAYQREEIAERFYSLRLIYRDNWVRNNGPARGAIKPDQFVLLDWDLLRAGSAAGAVVPDPLAAAQPGSR